MHKITTIHFVSQQPVAKGSSKKRHVWKKIKLPKTTKERYRKYVCIRSQNSRKVDAKRNVNIINSIRNEVMVWV